MLYMALSNVFIQKIAKYDTCVAKRARSAREVYARRASKGRFLAIFLTNSK